MRTNVYVDGFNLYYGCLMSTPYRWLNLAELCRLALPRNTINRIRYFTALVKARPDDPQKPVRQQTYIRALQTIPTDPDNPLRSLPGAGCTNALSKSASGRPPYG